ncbi:hypothetical protein HPB50_010806 [Hyalomma asiaticum]|uniref:Uncharacterized protein n=1 Tax=Hyalomma asiaticum TaxID=266040 RepID=A0ACB7SM92_HYAAI|nr:hypothetical protein HPB50_010806 [Hyalomma asiaticum]
MGGDDPGYKGGKPETDRHLGSAKHKKTSSSLKGTRTLASMPSVSGHKKMDTQVKEAEIRTLPRGVEDMARDIFNYFLSPKQTLAYKEFQRLADVKPDKLLHPSQTRWLSLHVVATRLLEQMPALITFFKKAATEDRLLAAESILEKLNDPSTKLYLQFLEYVSPFFTNLKEEM